MFVKVKNGYFNLEMAESIYLSHENRDVWKIIGSGEGYGLEIDPDYVEITLEYLEANLLKKSQ